MARTVFSVSQRQRQTPDRKTSSSKGNVVASIASMARTSLSSTKSLPPKKLARIAKKMENVPEVKTRKDPSSNVDNKATAVKKTAGEGLKGKYINMIAECIFQLKQKNGSSRVVIANQLKLQFASVIGYNETDINLNIKLALKKGLDEGVFKMAKGSGKGSGSYKLTENEIKKLKKKLNKQPVTAKMKQQTVMSDFLTTTPRPSIESPQSFVSLENVTSFKLNRKASVDRSVLITPNSIVQSKIADNNSSLKKRAKSPEEPTKAPSLAGNIKTPESFVLLNNIMNSVKRNASPPVLFVLSKSP